MKAFVGDCRIFFIVSDELFVKLFSLSLQSSSHRPLQEKAFPFTARNSLFFQAERKMKCSK